MSFHLGHVGGMMRAAAPYALLMFLMSIYMRSDVPLLERLYSPQEAGRYMSAVRQLDVCNQFAILFAGILLPLFGRMLAQGQDVAPIARLSTNLLLPLAFLAAVIAWSAGTGIMHMLYPAATARDGRIFAWVMSCLPAYALMYIYSTLLTANGSMRLLNLQAAGAAVLSVSVNCLVIPRYGAEGAAMVSCGTQWSIAVSTLFFSSRRNRLPFSPRWIAGHLLYLLVMLLLAWAAFSLWPGEWVRVSLSLVAAAAVLIPAFHFVSPRALAQLISNR
ncbi:MAG: polysaccharide biosynthesis C-terminal domain-containing protein [Bacteroidetes bacterium]|nr:polysaccharide biosynthesis C-terminal domain-containing protein [Bacteroidota bacterium]